jgi:hypothetical protein
VLPLKLTLDSYPTDQYDDVDNSNLCRGKDGEAVAHTFKPEKNLGFFKVDTCDQIVEPLFTNMVRTFLTWPAF